MFARRATIASPSDGRRVFGKFIDPSRGTCRGAKLGLFGLFGVSPSFIAFFFVITLRLRSEYAVNNGIWPNSGAVSRNWHFRPLRKSRAKHGIWQTYGRVGGHLDYALRHECTVNNSTSPKQGFFFKKKWSLGPAGVL